MEEEQEKLSSQSILINAAFDMLDSVETIIEPKVVSVRNTTTYEEEDQEQHVVKTQPTFRGNDRQRIKDWLLSQLV